MDGRKITERENRVYFIFANYSAMELHLSAPVTIEFIKSRPTPASGQRLRRSPPQRISRCDTIMQRCLARPAAADLHQSAQNGYEVA